MKTNFILLIILLLTVSFGNAQSIEKEGLKTNKVIAAELINNNDTEEKITEDSKLIDNVEFEAILARSTSDIRSYLNRERNISNIGLLFPNIEERVKA